MQGVRPAKAGWLLPIHIVRYYTGAVNIESSPNFAKPALASWSRFSIEHRCGRILRVLDCTSADSYFFGFFMNKRNYLIRTLIESIRSGTIAALVIVPLGPLFKAAGLRIGHYGPKFAALFFDDPQSWLLFLQHLVVGWVSALPLLLILTLTIAGKKPVWTGAGYGVAYYVVVNSLALPLYFGDTLPWQLGVTTVLPSLFGHLVYGASIGLTSKRFVAESACAQNKKPA